MRKTYITAFAIGAGTVVWMASGQLDARGPGNEPTVAQRNAQREAASQDRGLAAVRAQVIEAAPQTAYANIRGRTQNKRTVEVRAETAGRVVERPVERGDPVRGGDVLCRLSQDDRNARLLEAREAVNQARIEHRGSLELKSKGFNSEAAIAAARARLAAAGARLKSMELDIRRTRVRAPFDGMAEVTHVEVGDFMRPGEPCVTVVDLDPMLLVGQIAEKDVSRLRIGEQASGRLATGGKVTGTISFVGQQADAATRTYRVEVEVPNPQYALRSGITVDIEVPAETRLAHRISPALFTLDDAGAVVVRTVDDDRRVAFHRVEILHDDGAGVWVTGLPHVATLITVGHEYVIPGERVQVDFERGVAVAEATVPKAAPAPMAAGAKAGFAGEGRPDAGDAPPSAADEAVVARAEEQPRAAEESTEAGEARRDAAVAPTGPQLPVAAGAPVIKVQSDRDFSGERVVERS